MAWFNVNWPYRNKFTINNVGQAALTEFPVTINILPGSGRYIRWDLIRNTGADIRFADADGVTELNYDIERIDPTLNTLVAHVKIPIIASGAAAQEFYMYYGNGKAVAPAAAFKQATWDANFVLVHHMDERSGLYLDSTANATHSIVTSGTLIYTNRYVGFRFTNNSNGLMDMFRPSVLNDITNLTVECIGIQSANTGFQTLIDKTRWYLNLNTGKPEFFRDFDGASDGKWITNAAVWGSLNVPHHIAVTYIKSSPANVPIIYVDGASVAITATNTPTGGSNPVTDATKHLRYGKQSDPARNQLTGSMDELRISNVVRSSDWIKATNKTLTNRMVSRANPLEQATPSGNVIAWWDSNWGYRKKINTDTAAYTYVSGQHFLRTRFDTATPIGAGKMNAGMDDLRVVRQIASGFYECPRYIASGVSPPWVYFPCAKSLPSGINLGADAVVHYYIYYGNPTPGVTKPLKNWYNYNCPQAPWSPRLKSTGQTASGWYDKLAIRFNESVGSTFFKDHANNFIVTNHDYRPSGTVGIAAGQQGRLETSIYIPGDTANRHIMVRNKHWANPSGNWMVDFWYKPRQLNATSNYIVGQWQTAAANFTVDIGGKAVKGRVTVAEAAANVMAQAAQALIASSGKWYYCRVTGKYPFGAAANTRRMFNAVSGTWGKKTHYADISDVGARNAAATTAKNLFIGGLYNAANAWQGGFDGWIEAFRFSTWPGDLFPSGINKQWTKPWMVSSEYIMTPAAEEAFGPPPGPTYTSVPWARMGGYTRSAASMSGIAHIGGYIDCAGHPVPVGRVGGYLLSKSLQHAYAAGILGGYTEGLVNSPTNLGIVGGYISSVQKTDVPWALIGGIASGLRNRSGYIGAYIVAHPAEVKYVEHRDRTLVKANSEQVIGQGLNIDSVVTFKGVNSTDFYALFNILNTQNAEFKARTKVTRYKRPPIVQITSVTPNAGGLINGVRQVTVTATGTLVDGNRWTHAYIDFGDPLNDVSPITYNINASISGFSATNPIWTATHDYHESGVYKIIARAQDDYGMIGTDASGVNLNQGLVPGTDYPFISISANPRSGTVPTSLRVDFATITSGTAPRGGISSPADARILWNFGNRESSQNKNPTTHYNSPGLYAPTLRYRYVNPSGTVIWVQDTLLLGYNV